MKKLIVLFFVNVFISYSPWFCGSSAIYNDHSTRYLFQGMTKKSSFSCFIVVFLCYCSHFGGSTALYMFESYDQKLVVFAFYGRFHDLFPTVFGVSGRFAWLERPDTCLRVRTKIP